MVEHMSAQSKQHQHQQSFNGVQTQRWQHRHRHHRGGSVLESPDVTSDSPAVGHHRFSLFRWFKRRGDSTSGSSTNDNRTRRRLFRRAKRRASTSSSTSSSVNTFYSTATVRSFAFHSGTRRSLADAGATLTEYSSDAVGPFAPGAVKLVEKRGYGGEELRGRVDAATTCTLPSTFSQRQDIQTRYSLHPVSNPFISYDSIPVVHRGLRSFAEARRNYNRNNCNNNNDNFSLTVVVDTLTSDSSLSGVRRTVHVKGKRRAPDPPTQRIVSVHAVGASGGVSRPASGGRRKRRPAPKPPGYTETLSSNQDTLSSGASIGMDSFVTAKDCQTISNDTLVLRRGILLSKKEVRLSPSRSKSRTPTTSVCDSDGGAPVLSSQSVTVGTNTKLGTIMPRPWYKRNILNEHSNTGSRDSTSMRRAGGGDILRGLSSSVPTEITKDEIASSASTSSTLSSSFPFEGSLSRLGFFYRGDRHQQDDSKRKENKRKSGISILTNISELDKEAAAIVQEEQARNRASMILQAARIDEDLERRMAASEHIVQDIVNSSMESSSPRRSTRALISKFNAIGSITKVAGNSGFFSAKNSSAASPKAKAKRYSQEYNNAHRDNKMDGRMEGDLLKYNIPHQPSPKRESTAMFTEVIIPSRVKVTSADLKPPTPLMTMTTATTTTTTTATPSAKAEKSVNVEFAKSLTAELDDVATGIARLRRELADRPKIIEHSVADREKLSEQPKEAPTVTPVNKLTAARDRELTNFDKEFTKIFDEIDRQLRTRDSRIVAEKTRTNNSSTNENSISSQVAKVLDILVGVEKEAAATRNPAPTPTRRSMATNATEDSDKTKELRTSAVRISGVDDKSTAELKEMLKEMKHSLPKHPKPARRNATETDRKPTEEANKSTPEAISGSKLTTSSYRSPAVEKPVSPPRASTKVSSGVQTSGNVRRIVNDATPSSSDARSRDAANHVVTLETRNAVLVPRSSYHLTRAHEVAVGEESKTRPENTYANVIEKSLYANAQVTPPQSQPQPLVDKPLERDERESTSRVKIDLRGGDTREIASPLLPRRERKSSLETARNDSNEGEKLEEIKKQYMNTLAVNRLLRKLEAAIASGHHQQAAGLAKELAQLKIHCSVVRQRSCTAKVKLNLSLYIEDKQAHQGPIPLQLPVNMTVAQLKAKIHIEYDIPANVQRWIIGKNLADNDESTLEELQAVEGSPVFLYLVAPPDLQDKEAIKEDKQQQEVKEEENELVEGEKGEEERAEQGINEMNDEQIREIKAENESQPKYEAEPHTEPAGQVEPEPQAQALEVREDSLTKEQKLQRYEELMSLENCDVISNTEPIECPVCFMISTPGEGVILRDCLHSFCRLCVANTVRYCEEAEVKCPYRDVDYTCESTLQEREIKALVAPEVYQQHLAKSIAQAENNAGNNAFHCKTPDCPGWCIYDDDVNNFLCPVCKVNNCLTCQAVHMGKNCRQYQEELKYSKETDHESKRTAAMLEEMVDRGEALPCPTCAVVLMKKWGCDWLRCSMCKTEICWVTRGPRWGPAGKGDTSGGCRCGENGVKCHPRCNYCH